MVSVTRPVILQREGERIPAAPDSSCSSSVFSALQAEQTGLMLVNVSFVLDVPVFISSLSLFDTLIAYSETDVSEAEEEEGG